MMAKFIIDKLNILMAVFIGLFIVSYILFSSWGTSLGFKMDQIVQKQNEAREEYEQIMAVLAQNHSRDVMLTASAGLGMVELTLADGYIDIRPEAVSANGPLAKKPQ